jgi:plastocyanin
MGRVRFVLGIFILMAGLLAGCSSNNSELEPVSIAIDMTEYTFMPDTVEVNVGQEVTLELTNNGLLPHELMIGREVVTTDNLPSGYQVDMFEQAGVSPTVTGETTEPAAGVPAHSGFMVVVAPNGAKASMTFPVTQEMVGDWEMGCFEQNGVHYIAGMKGTFKVNP